MNERYEEDRIREGTQTGKTHGEIVKDLSGDSVNVNFRKKNKKMHLRKNLCMFLRNMLWNLGSLGWRYYH